MVQESTIHRQGLDNTKRLKFYRNSTIEGSKPIFSQWALFFLSWSPVLCLIQAKLISRTRCTSTLSQRAQTISGTLGKKCSRTRRMTKRKIIITMRLISRQMKMRSVKMQSWNQISLLSLGYGLILYIDYGSYFILFLKF